MMTEHAVDRAAGWTVRRKMDLVLFFGLVLFPMTLLLLGSSYGYTTMNNIIVIHFVLAVILFVPLSKALSHLMAVRNIRDLNDQCRRLKEGDYSFMDIPPRPEGDKDFFSLKHNLHWMGYAIASRERKLTHALNKLSSAQRQIESGLDYASLIQASFLPDARELNEAFHDHFLLLDQRDRVGGDSYWIKRWGTGYFIAVADCTGHGVPGAFMTLIVHSLFEKIAACYSGTSPAAVLGRMNRLIKDSLGQHLPGSRSDDGMDCALCWVEPKTRRLIFAGAGMSLYLADTCRIGSESHLKIRWVKGDRPGLGYVRTPTDAVFTDKEFQLCAGSRVYMFTDGLTDQVGGPKRLPFGRKRLTSFLDDLGNVPLKSQGRLIEQAVEQYMGAEPRRDDITALGFEL